LFVLYVLEVVVFEAVSQLTAATNLASVLIGTVMLGLAKLMAAYARHSGVASIQIGLMRALGWQIGERYNYPLAARSPREFWSRWNIYVADWVKRYAYFPLAVLLARRATTHKAGAHVISLGVTFIAVGAYHDLHSLLAKSSPTLHGTAFFAANALLLLLWAGFERRVMTPRGAFALALLGVLGVWR
jgi:D-alanyl-lipoteichoic acid acyltransferase DltB (MBOAT superfamily)